MDKSISFAEKLLIGYSLINVGYRDYIAARFLLNNRFTVQGLTLASTAIEKYLKAVLVIASNEKVRYDVHLDNLEKLKTLLSKNNCDITEKFDQVFLNILVNAFKIRYYDKLKRPIIIGFYVNQFIGELDDTIDIIETYVLKTVSETPFRRAIKSKDPHLYYNNFKLNNQDKKEFMEQPDDGFSIYVRSGTVVNEEKIVTTKNFVNKYERQIATFTEFQPNWV